jgi:hypothetical protein
MARPSRAIVSLVTWGTLLAVPALAQWSPDPTLNNPVAVAPDTQSPVVAVSDGAGGAIFVWRNERFDLGTFVFVYDLLAQRISASGVVQWAPAGVALVTDSVAVQATLLRPPFAAVADGAGGVIAVWRDTRNFPDTGEIFAQRVNGAGAPQWTAGGVSIASAPDLQQRPVIVSDGSGGAIMAWEDRRNGFGNVDIFAQRVNAAGATQWAANGVAVSVATGDQLLPAIAPDGANGAIIAWTDNRGTDGEIFAQRMQPAGTALWTANGVALTNVAGVQTRPTIASDGAAGAIVAWEDDRNAADNDVYARRISAAGTPQWTADGVQVVSAANATVPAVVADLAGGAIVVWTDERYGGGNTVVFAQRLNAAGVPQWTANGVSVCGATGGQFFPAATADGSGGVVIGWEDGRSDPGDVFAQRLNASGAGVWSVDGRPVSTAANAQGGVTVAPDGSGGGIFAWGDGRAVATGVDVFAAHVDGSGGLPVTLESFTVE